MKRIEGNIVTKREYLLACLAEELGEVAEECLRVQKRIHKTLRFSEGEIQEGQEATNIDRVWEELGDLEGTIAKLKAAGFIKPEAAERKQLKIDRMMEHSRRHGVLPPEDDDAS